MHHENLELWQHSHTFGQDLKRPGEARTLIVIALTATMMVVEVVAGVLLGSMALLADGLHMASHTAALGISLLAYVYARRHAGDAAYSFGTGKVNALGGFTGAILLAVFALFMAWESVHRFVEPVDIVFDQAILVAVLGLVVNGASVLVLGAGGHHHHDHGGHHEHHDHHGHDHHGHDHHGHDHHGHEDHNLRSAYLHVLADALTSILAIVALLMGKYLGAVWMDPLMGIVGAVLVACWSVGLLRVTSGVLLDRQAGDAVRSRVREAIEADGDSRVTDLHVWAIGPAVHAAIVTVVAGRPLPPEAYKSRLSPELGLAHVSVEVHRCPGPG